MSQPNPPQTEGALEKRFPGMTALPWRLTGHGIRNKEDSLNSIEPAGALGRYVAVFGGLDDEGERVDATDQNEQDAAAVLHAVSTYDASAEMIAALRAVSAEWKAESKRASEDCTALGNKAVEIATQAIQLRDALRETLGFWQGILAPMPGATVEINLAHARAFAEHASKAIELALGMKP